MKTRKIVAVFLALLFFVGAFGVVPAAASDTPYKGIDVSSWQGDIDWTKTAAAGVDYAIIRAYAYGKDKRFDEYYDGATENGIYVGSYVYMYATTAAEARTEAKNTLAVLAGRALTFPLYLDVEDERLTKLGKSELTDLVLIELQAFAAAGYIPAIYTSQSYGNKYLEMSRLASYDLWLAWWPLYAPDDSATPFVHSDQDPYTTNPLSHMWQFSNGGDGKVYGTQSKFVDLDFCYYDYIGGSRDLYPYTSTNPDDYYIPKRNISYTKGKTVMTGFDVAWVQAVLYRLGYNVAIDGSFGPASQSAVKQFQRDNGILSDGIVGAKTRPKMIERWSEARDLLCTFVIDPNGSNGKVSSYTVNIGEVFTIPVCTFTRDFGEFIGWAILRSDGKYALADGTWGEEGEIRTYFAGEKYTLDATWLEGAGHRDFTFTPVWLCLHDYQVSEEVIPTYTDEGYTVYTCTQCGDSYTVTVPRLILRGDANGDGRVTIKDVLILRKYLMGLVEAEMVRFDNSDVTYDGKTDIKDVLRLRKYLSGLDTLDEKE